MIYGVQRPSSVLHSPPHGHHFITFAPFSFHIRSELSGYLAYATIEYTWERATEAAMRLPNACLSEPSGRTVSAFQDFDIKQAILMFTENCQSVYSTDSLPSSSQQAIEGGSVQSRLLGRTISAIRHCRAFVQR